jgi:ferrous iron transport protein B
VSVAHPVAAAAARPRRILLVGNPNSGKTTLFNRLCGLRAKTANFPGTTVDLRRGKLSLPTRHGDSEALEVIDLPGIYGFALDLPESRVAAEALVGADGVHASAAIVVADATNLSRHLLLVGELARQGLPFVLALNMIDLARRRGLSFDLAKLARAIGAPVVPVAARSGEGVDRLLSVLGDLLSGAAPPGIAEAPAEGSQALEEWAERVVVESVGGREAIGRPSDTLIDRLDVTFTHPFVGLVIFHLVMALLFWTIFALATVPMDLIEATFAHLGQFLTENLSAGPVRELLIGGLISGVAGTIVFLPQICLLFFLITILEDTGYLARAAFVMDRLLYRFGLPGYAFVPLISSHACAIPGILSTRLIPDRHDRFATILVAPFMSCSARVPVYVLLTSFLFPHQPWFAGIAFTSCYLLGAVAAMGSAFLARRTLLPGTSRPMVLELPSYKWPSLRVAVMQAATQGWSFLSTVGTVIVALSFVMWWLSAYPKAGPAPEAISLRTAAVAADLAPARSSELVAEAGRIDAKFQQERSFAGRMGRVVEPVFAPLGYDWRLTMGVLTAFAARETFVSTLAVLTGAADQGGHGILSRIQSARRDDGRPLLSPATAVSLLVFFVLAMQCLSTMVTVRRETRSWRWPLLQFAWMTALAWIGAFGTFQVLRLAGVA